MSYPSSTDSFAGFTSTDTLQHDNHAAQHNQEQAAIVAIENKIGTGTSTPTSTSVLVGNGAGTSTWGTVNLTNQVNGVLPTTNGGTGTTSTTGTGSSVFNTSPTISNANLTSQPTITDFTNAQHNHQSASGGGTLGAAAITGVNSSVLYNPYKFAAYKGVDQTNGSANVATKVTYPNEDFDTSNNYDAPNSKFVVPIAGFYYLSASVQVLEITAANVDLSILLYKNGNRLMKGGNIKGSAYPQPAVSGVFPLAVNDYIEVYFVNVVTGGEVLEGVTTSNRFQGFLVSAT